MTYTAFISVDQKEIEAAEYAICLTQWDDYLGFDKLFEVESENESHAITGLDHLRKALVSVRVYRRLDQAKWKNIKEVIYTADQCGAYVEFESKEDAMLFKLASRGEA